MGPTGFAAHSVLCVLSSEPPLRVEGSDREQGRGGVEAEGGELGNEGARR